MEKVKLLLIDDEEELIFTLAERLMLRGFEADAVTNPADAIKLIEKKVYDLAIIDIKLPGINGIELMKIIREIIPNIKIILLTGHGTPEEGKKAKLDGASEYLIKPININELIGNINKLLFNY